jgi:hypothetical protein
MIATPNPLFAATYVQPGAEKSKDSKMAFALTGHSIALVAMMALRELRSLFGNEKASHFEPHARHER